MKIRIKKTLQPTIENNKIVFGKGNPTLERSIPNTNINIKIVKYLNNELSREEIPLDDTELSNILNKFSQLGLLTSNDYQTQQRYSRNLNFYEWIDTSANINPSKYQERLSKANIIIFGLGGIGANVAEQLVRTGVKNITLLDFDKVDSSNLTRQGAYIEKDNTHLKTEACKSYLSSIDSTVKVNTINTKITSYLDLQSTIESLKRPINLMINCMDKPKNIDKWFDKLSDKYNIPVLFGSYASTCANVFPKIPNVTLNYSDFLGENGIEDDSIVKCEFPTAVIAPVTYMAAGLVAYDAVLLLTELRLPTTAIQIDFDSWETLHFDIKK